MHDLHRHINAYAERGIDEERFCICGSYDYIEVCRQMEELTGKKFESKEFIEEQLFAGSTQYPLNCMLFYPEGMRNQNEDVIREEVENLYWYCDLT